MKKTLLRTLICLGILLPAKAAFAQAVEPFKLYKAGIDEISLSEALKDVQAGDIVLMGEQHGTVTMADQQVAILETLRAQGLKVSVGMEFFEKPIQPDVDAMRLGLLSEEQFLAKILWKGFPYSSYRRQVNFPRAPQEFVIALNAPRSLTSRISKVGIAGLAPDEKALLPSDFQIGNAAYLRRFEEAMGGHVNPDSLTRYFEAQSTWDEVMSVTAIDFLEKHPDQVLVIVVGEFHTQYGGGLPDRLKARLQKTALPTRLTTFSLINLEGMSQDEREQMVRPNGDGARADFVWTSQF